MTKEEKKELFLLILENWFNDSTNEIHENNCIAFYLFFIDYLQFEAKFNPQDTFGLNLFLSSIVKILSNLEDYSKQHIFHKSNLLSYFEKLSTTTTTDNAKITENCFKELGEIYLLAKEEFFI